jgi:surface antigen
MRLVGGVWPRLIITQEGCRRKYRSRRGDLTSRHARPGSGVPLELCDGPLGRAVRSDPDTSTSPGDQPMSRRTSRRVILLTALSLSTYSFVAETDSAYATDSTVAPTTAAALPASSPVSAITGAARTMSDAERSEHNDGSAVRPPDGLPQGDLDQWLCRAWDYSCVAGTGYSGQSVWGSWGPGHNCVSYAAYRLQQNGAAKPWDGRIGNAFEWDEFARGAGVPVDRNPAVGAIAQWDTGQAGHVAYVEEITADYIVVSEDSYESDTSGYTSRRLLDKAGGTYAAVEFIHVRDVPTGNPIGYVDAVVGQIGGFINIAGWIFDPDQPTAPARIHVYVDGPAGTGVFKGEFVANLRRDDVAVAYPHAGPHHGFAHGVGEIPAGSHAVYIYGINVAGGGSNPLLGFTTVNVDPPAAGSPFGNFEQASDEEAAAGVVGWTIDADAVTIPTRVHIYVDGWPGWRGVIKFADIGDAGIFRQDVADAFPEAGGYHGFNAIVGDLPPGSHTMWAYAINAEGGGDNPLLGVRHINVSPAGVPSAPAEVAATPGDASALVSWKAPDDGGSQITGYTVMADPGGISVETDKLSTTVGGLTNGITYVFTVTARNAVGEGAASAPSNPVIPHAPTCGPPGTPRSSFYRPSQLDTRRNMPEAIKWLRARGTGCTYELEKAFMGYWLFDVYAGAKPSHRGSSVVGEGLGWQYRVRSVDPLGAPSEWVTGTAFDVVGWQEDEGATYAGKFVVREGSKYWNERAAVTRRPSASVTFEIEGSTAAVIGTRCPGCGSARLYVDEALRDTVDMSSSTTRHRSVLAEWSGTFGRHTIRLEKTAEPGGMIIDGFVGHVASAQWR